MNANFTNGASGAQVNFLPISSGARNHATSVGSELRWWHRFTLGQFSRVIFKGFRTQISQVDLFPLEDGLKSHHCLETFERKWLKEQKIRARKRGFEAVPTEDLFPKTPYAPTTTTTSKNTIWAALFRSFWPVILRGFCYEFFIIMGKLMTPLMLGALIDEVSSARPFEIGFGYCLALFIASLSTWVALEHLLFSNCMGGLQARAALMSAVYQKSLLISMDSQRAYPVGELMNMMSLDVENVFRFVGEWHLLWAWMVRLAGTLALLWMQLGVSSLAGVAVMLAQMPLSAIIGHKNSNVQNKQMKEKGRRISILTEILSGIRFIKLYAWEKAFAKKVEDVRQQEVGYIKKFLLYQAALSLIWSSVPLLISLASFGCFVLLDDENVLTPKRVFVSMTLFNSMSFTLTFVPTMIATFTRCKVSLRRIQNFLQADELDLDDVTHAVGEGEVVVFEKASFAWESSIVLDKLDLKVRKGELIAIIGPVGSGKSSLMEAILGSMKKITGHVHKDKASTMAYVPQRAWILNDSIRNNIVFTSDPDESWYREVVDRCCLLPDFQMLEHNDDTEIGEKGINLSGGQKQRVSLARAVFQKAQLYLLDDPLSSVDSHVLQDLFNDVIGPQGLLKDTTRILVTHSQAVLPLCDRIVLLKEGKIDFVGTYNDLIKEDVSMKTILGESEGENDTRTADEPEEEQKIILNSHGSKVPQNEEEMSVGAVSWRVYLMMVKKFGLFYAGICLLGYGLHEIGMVWSMFWLKTWSTDAKHQDDDLMTALNDTMHATQDDLRENSSLIERIGQDFVKVSADFSAESVTPIDRINMFVFIGSIQMTGLVVGCLCLAIGILKTSTSLHQSVLDAIMRAPLQFFDKTPSGRNINRMSKDVDALDQEFFLNLDGWLCCVLSIFSVLVVIAYEVPLLLSVIVPCACLFVLLLTIYQRNARQLQRLASVTRSPVLSHFSETVSGSASIRAFHAEQKVTKKFLDRLDTSQNFILHTRASGAWIALRTQLLSSLIVFSLSLIIIFHREQFNEGLAGLLLSLSLMAIDRLNWVFRLSSWVENTLVSAERLDQYSKIPSEKPWIIENTVDPLWPLSGSVRFRDYSTSYGPGENPVLSRINVEIEAGEKVGVVGRTGAGKTSLTLALFRAIEATSGTIFVDGLDVSGIGLHDLRKRLTIIPQDPVLFRGTLRENLDPHGIYSDEEIWSAIERAHLKKSQFSLKMTIADGGENISVGERQLVSLARALLRSSKIIVLDEATAAVDHETDKLVQETIRRDFQFSTVITVAHRLETVLNYDKIVVLSGGEIVEQGSPKELLGSRNSVFYSMAKDAGIV
ncbi:canalicular multispecific organic anion transporter 1 [Galendromus occidentalis]|uniref:Canalicular multispecific organic anion transporter 1 n=1 Tax=Galendromus occidentalis TaxID=34638 RepID=A0AAJ6QX04_9ACAR|nr:canalicular multispecific organic anion transporter 1 [Galendromus occidentalis]